MSDSIHRAISERILSLSQAYTLKIECTYEQRRPNRAEGFTIAVVGFLSLMGTNLPTSIGGYGTHIDNQSMALLNALEVAYKDADPQSMVNDES